MWVGVYSCLVCMCVGVNEGVRRMAMCTWVRVWRWKCVWRGMGVHVRWCVYGWVCMRVWCACVLVCMDEGVNVFMEENGCVCIRACICVSVCYECGIEYVCGGWRMVRINVGAYVCGSYECVGVCV